MSHRAKVTWVPADQGGRSALPTATRYINISRFPEDPPSWPDGSWSIVLEFDTPPSAQGSPSLGTARFLVDEAPHERLQRGRSFDVFEGTRHTATVELLE
jgi:hypothetical protein